MSSNTGSNQNAGSNSLSGFLSTLIPTLPLAALYIAVFLIFRARAKRVYEPRATLCTYREWEKSPKTSDSLFGWIPTFYSIPDAYVLSHQSLDSYLYLRFFKVLIVTCFVGCILTWPILFPVNATGPGGQKQLDAISFSNVPNSGNRYYAHVFVSWIFYGFVMFVIAKESLFFIKLRQAYLLSPFIESRMSTRTVLYTDIPEEYMTESKLRSMFASVRHVWLASNTKDLAKLVEEREKTAIKLEGAEIKLSKQANKLRLKHKEEPADTPDRFLHDVKRPTHREKYPIIGKKVDSIDFCRNRISELTPKIERQQASHWQGKEKNVGAAFIEFETVSAAETAFQTVISRNPKYFQARAIGQTPDQIVYDNLDKKWYTRDILRAVFTTVICALIVFWAIPVAFIGSITNINYLTSEVPFLSFINNVPDVILGVITGLLPTILLAILMSLVPVIIRYLMKLSGCVSKAEIELRTQSLYFWFQVIQVFLVTTMSSAASSAAAQIVGNPASVVTLLATSLPKASNFYINYFVLYGIALSTKTVAQVIALAIWVILAKVLDSTPRKLYNRYVKVGGLSWGSTYPVYCNLGVIAFTYAVIAPLVLGFATIGIACLYIVFRYNVFYTLDSGAVNTQGRNYAMALSHLMTGVFLGELCLIGLIAINTAGSKAAAGPLILAIIGLIFTVLFYISMHRALKPLMGTLPRDLMMKNMESSPRQTEEGYATDMSDTQYSNRDSMASTQYMARTMPEKSGSKSYVARLIKPSALPPFAAHMSHPVPEYPTDIRREAYVSPSVTAPSPIVWIVHDEMGISEREKSASGKVIGTSDYGAWWETGTGKLKTSWQKDGEERKVQDVPIYQKPVDY